MGEYQITCCSTVDMPREYFEEKKLPYACFNFEMDGVTYQDDLGVSMSYEEFYDKIKNGSMPITSQVSPEDYIEIFEPLLEKGIDVIHLSMSTGITGTYNSAVVAANMVKEKYPDRKVTIIDSLAASSGYGLLVDTVLEKQESGLTYEEMVEWIEENKLRVHHWFFSIDLSHYIRGGRISKASGMFGTMLNICPLLNMNLRGELTPRQKIRGKAKVIKETVQKMETHGENGYDYNGKVFICNSACREDAEAVAKLVKEKFPKMNGEPLITTIGTTIGAHTGPGTVSLFFWGDERID